MPSISTSSPHSGDSWMNYSSNSSDDFSGLSEQIKAVTSGRQTGNNSSDDASSDYESSIISHTEAMLKRYKSQKSQQDSFDVTPVATATSLSQTDTSSLTAAPTLLPAAAKKPPIAPTSTATTTASSSFNHSPASSTASSLKSVRGAVKRLRCCDDDDADDENDAHGDKNEKFSVAKKSITEAQHAINNSTPSSAVASPTKLANVVTTPPAPSSPLNHTSRCGVGVVGGDISNNNHKMNKQQNLNNNGSSSNTNTNLTKRKSTTATAAQRLLRQHMSKSLDITSSTAAMRHVNNAAAATISSSSAIDDCPVDVRLIDFAHTAFVPRNGSIFLPTPPAVPVHHGPDGGFLTGLDSLNRLLNEILAEEI